MKFTPLLVCIFVLVCAASSKDLMCYSCFYYDGHSSSDSSCLTKPTPSMLKNCTSPKIPGLQYNISDSATLTDGALKCTNYTGMLNKKKIVILGCELIDYSFDCISSEIDVVEGEKQYTTSVSLDGVSVTSAEACFCPNDYCNGPQPPKPTTTTSVPITSTTQKSSGAGSHLTSYSLFTATIVYCMYKCVSLGFTVTRM